MFAVTVSTSILHTYKRTICNEPAADLQQCCFNNFLSRCVCTSCPQLVDALLATSDKIVEVSYNSL